MSTNSKGQVIQTAAMVYDEFFVPALFEEWNGRLVKAAQLQSGQSVVDIACGTGTLTVAAANAVGSEGEAVGVDINPGMLDVARQKAPSIEWILAPAEQLPFENGRFDACVSQFGLMFFEDRQKAIAEMLRVLKPGGNFAVAVWDSLENTPGYTAVTHLLTSLFGKEIATEIAAPFCLGDKAEVAKLFPQSGIEAFNLVTIKGQARFDSIEKWMYTDIKGWTLADLIDDAQYAQLLERAKIDLAKFTNEQGQVRFDSPAHIITGRKSP